MTRNEPQSFFRIDDYSYSLTGLYTGKEATKPAHFWQGLRHHFIFHLISGGEGTLKTDTATFSLKKGDGFFVLPNERVRYQASQTRPWQYLWVGFTGVRVMEILALAGIRPENPVVRGIESKEFSQQMERIVTVVRIKKNGYEVKANGILYDLVARLIESNTEAPILVSPRQDEYVDRITRFIAVNYGQELSVTQLAAAVGLDRSYLTLLFKKKTGMSLNDYLIHFRMEKAKELLLGPGLSINEISFSVGYSDPYAFSKRFKKITGMNPNEFRSREKG
ncbi:MAG: AraC family transcriptional regulator [Spirochaetia bacterium]|nr:AraC family transcriptional regulator [Spirochaetia bacterium]